MTPRRLSRAKPSPATQWLKIAALQPAAQPEFDPDRLGQLAQGFLSSRFPEFAQNFSVQKYRPFLQALDSAGETGEFQTLSPHGVRLKEVLPVLEHFGEKDNLQKYLSAPPKIMFVSKTAFFLCKTQGSPPPPQKKIYISAL